MEIEWWVMVVGELKHGWWRWGRWAVAMVAIDSRSIWWFWSRLGWYLLAIMHCGLWWLRNWWLLNGVSATSASSRHELNWGFILSAIQNIEVLDWTKRSLAYFSEKWIEVQVLTSVNASSFKTNTCLKSWHASKLRNHDQWLKPISLDRYKWF